MWYWDGRKKSFELNSEYLYILLYLGRSVEMQRICCHSGFTWNQIRQFCDLISCDCDHFEGSKYFFCENVMTNVKNFQNIKIQGCDKGLNSSFYDPKIANFHFTWSERKFLTFLHCVEVRKHTVMHFLLFQKELAQQSFTGLSTQINQLLFSILLRLHLLKWFY